MGATEYVVVVLIHEGEDKRLLALQGTPNPYISSSVSSSRSLFASRGPKFGSYKISFGGLVLKESDLLRTPVKDEMEHIGAHSVTCDSWSVRPQVPCVFKKGLHFKT